MTLSRSRRSPLVALLGMGLALLPAAPGGAAAAKPSPVLAAACAGTLQTTTAGTVASDALTEISGIAASHRNRGMYWVHNDSGDTARVFAIDLAGATRGEFSFEGASAIDWEDIAVGPGPGQTAKSRSWSIYAGDIGGNNVVRDSVVVYRVPEPAVAKAAGTSPSAPVALTGVAALTFTYPDGPHDAETLLVDPRSHDLVIVTKELVSGQNVAYRGRADGAAGSTSVLERVADVPLGIGGGATGGDVSWDGGTVALRTYLGVVLFPRPAGKPVWQAFTQQSCTGAAPAIGDERQGEAIGFVPGGRAYVTVGEGVHPPVHRFTASG